jgi:hypothetical protein
MMMKRMCSVAMVVLLVCTASLGFAQVVTVIGDFEGASNDYDGWSVNNGIGTSTSFDSAIHATSGSQALSVFSNSGVSGAGNNFNWAITYGGPWPARAPVAILADVSWKTSEWSPNTGWAQWKELAVNSELGGWVQLNSGPVSDTSNPGSPGGWDPSNFGESDTRTLTWDLTSVVDPAGWENSAWKQINLAVNWDGLITAGGSFWIDNIRLVSPIPEPTSLTLVGLCGVCALVRRR